MDAAVEPFAQHVVEDDVSGVHLGRHAGDRDRLGREQVAQLADRARRHVRHVTAAERGQHVERHQFAAARDERIDLEIADAVRTAHGGEPAELLDGLAEPRDARARRLPAHAARRQRRQRQPRDAGLDVLARGSARREDRQVAAGAERGGEELRRHAAGPERDDGPELVGPPKPEEPLPPGRRIVGHELADGVSGDGLSGEAAFHRLQRLEDGGAGVRDDDDAADVALVGDVGGDHLDDGAIRAERVELQAGRGRRVLHEQAPGAPDAGRLEDLEPCRLEQRRVPAGAGLVDERRRRAYGLTVHAAASWPARNAARF